MFLASTSTAILNSVPPIAEDDAAQHMLRVRQTLNAILPSIYRFEFSTDGLRKWPAESNGTTELIKRLIPNKR